MSIRRIFIGGVCQVCGHLQGDHEYLETDLNGRHLYTCDDDCDEDLNGYCHAGRLETQGPPNPAVTHGPWIRGGPMGRVSRQGSTHSERITVMTTKTIGRDLPNGAYIEIRAELRTGGDLSPGFAISGSIWEKHGTWGGRTRKRKGLDSDAGGQVTEEILAVAPELAPIVKAHLSDPSGVPMHAVANGWYFYSGKAAVYERQQIAAGKDYGYSRMLERSDRERAAQALNIPASDLPEGLDEAGFKEFAEALAGTWAQQAANARAALDAMEDGDGVEES